MNPVFTSKRLIIKDLNLVKSIEKTINMFDRVGFVRSEVNIM